MGMRTDCVNYESRTYASGEVVRKCRIDLAPDAPWKCPDECPGFKKRTMDIGWNYGSLGEPANEPAESVDVNPEEAAALLNEAEDIINTAAPEILSEFEKKKAKRKRGRFKRRKK